MATNILSIGQSALAAAQVGLSTTGHNIANAATPGYNRQVVVQGTAQAQNYGFGFMGQGTEIATVKRIYSEFLGGQVRTALSTQSGLESYAAEIRQIDNLLGDPLSGLSPALQEFFSGVQEMASNPSSIPARQAALSAGESLAARFQSLAGRLRDIEQGINSQITSSVSVVNAYATQIGALNEAIGRAQSSSGQPANDLLDQRDQLIMDLNKEIKATAVKQGDGSVNVFIGNGQPLVVGAKTFELTTTVLPSDPSRIEVAYQTASGPVIVGEGSLAGGKLGGLIAFRSQSLEPAQAELDTLASGLASSFNAQHRLGQDLDGIFGGDFFTYSSALGAAGFVVALNDPRQIAAAAPIRTEAASANTGTGAVSAGTVNAPPPPNANLQQPVTITFTSATTFDVTGTGTGDPTGVAYTPGATITYNGWSITLSGAPAAGDTFTVSTNAGGIGDSRNAQLLAGLQTANTMNGGTASYQGAYSQLVSEIGNKTRELDVTSSAAGKLYTEAKSTLESESGVNLDEEGTNLLRYQQAYQAAGKIMQIASQMFDVLLSLGN